MNIVPIVLVFLHYATVIKDVPIRIDPNNCVSAPPAILPKPYVVFVDGDKKPRQVSWEHFRKYAQICPLIGPNGEVALRLLNLREDLMREDLNRKDPTGKTPSALLDERWPKKVFLDLHDHEIGQFDEIYLPEGYEAEKSIMTFTHWHHNFPYRIDMLQVDDVPEGTHAGPNFIWDAKLGRFVMER